MKLKIDDILRCLDDARDRLSKTKDKRSYCLILIEVRGWMDELEQTLTVGDLKNEKYAAAYNGIFSSKDGVSEYDRVCNYIDEHPYGSLHHRIF